MLQLAPTSAPCWMWLATTRFLRRRKFVRAYEQANESVDWDWGRQVSGALRYMHSKRIMHRDVKPANVLVTATGLKLGDLGLGRHFSTNTNEAFSKVASDPLP